MLFNLSPRWKPVRSTTSPLLGPNQYYLGAKDILKNSVPFLSSVDERPCTVNKYFSDALYNPKDTKTIIGGSSLRDKSTRLRICPPSGPSPFDYSPKLPSSSLVQKPPGPEEFKGRHLYVCRVPYSSESRGPSIPTKIDGNGYRFVDGKLVKNPPSNVNVTIGPAYYDVKFQDSMTSSSYKGRSWSSSKTERLKNMESKSPAPNTYDTSKKRTFNARDERVREMARGTAFVPRFLDAIVTRTRNDNFPAPSHYNIQETENHCHSKYMSRNPPAFNTRAKRFQSTNDESPGASSYCVSSEMIKFGPSMKASPFNTDCVRFPPKKELVTPGPGPSDYNNVNGSLEEKLVRKLRARTNFMPPFNQSAKREPTFISKEAELVPCPFEYTLEAPLVTSSVSASIFKSRTDRFPKINTLEFAGYDIREQFDKNRNSRSHNKSKVPFQSKRISRGFIFKPTSFYGPCPSSYAVHKSMGLVEGGKLGNSERFVDPAHRSPGPAAYDLPPCVASSICRAVKSHNLRFKKDAARSKLKDSSDVKRAEWCKGIKRRRVLKTFYRESDTNIVNWIDLL